MTEDNLLWGPHCSHHDLCSMHGCDQRGHIDYQCRRPDLCEYCGPDATCPMNSEVLASACPECHV